MKPSEIINKLAKGVARFHLNQTKKRLGPLSKSLIKDEDQAIEDLTPSCIDSAITIYLDILFNKGLIKHDQELIDSIEKFTPDILAGLLQMGTTAQNIMKDILETKKKEEEDKSDENDSH